MDKSRFAQSLHTFRRRIPDAVWEIVKNFFLVVATILCLFPLFWVAITAFKTKGDVMRFPPTLWPNPITVENFKYAFSVLPFARFFLNSIIIAVLNTAGTVLSSALIGYGFARYRAPGSKALFVVVLATLALPSEVTLIPVFMLFKQLGWVNTFLPLIVPAFFGNSYFIFLFRQFFRSIPRDLLDAATVDGASQLGAFWYIVAPLSGAVFATVTIFNFLWTWNDFFTPLIYLQKVENMTVAVGLAYFRGEYGTAWGPLMASALVSILPVVVLFIIVQKQITQGIVTTGLKG